MLLGKKRFLVKREGDTCRALNSELFQGLLNLILVLTALFSYHLLDVKAIGLQ